MKSGVQVRRTRVAVGGWLRGERMGGEVRNRKGMSAKKAEKDYLCIQEHCTVVSAARYTKRQRS